VNVLDLFSGIGGFSLGLERAGMRRGTDEKSNKGEEMIMWLWLFVALCLFSSVVFLVVGRVKTGRWW
jgi:hypothetical protein